MAHLAALGLTDLRVAPDPVRVASEAALWGAIAAEERLGGAVILSDDAGQFRVGDHALCWVHAERLVHKLVPANDRQRSAVEVARRMIWWFYRQLKAYKRAPSPERAAELKSRFDRIFKRRTGYATLDKLLKRLAANKDELLRVQFVRGPGRRRAPWPASTLARGESEGAGRQDQRRRGHIRFLSRSEGEAGDDRSAGPRKNMHNCLQDTVLWRGNTEISKFDNFPTRVAKSLTVITPWASIRSLGLRR